MLNIHKCNLRLTSLFEQPYYYGVISSVLPGRTLLRFFFHRSAVQLHLPQLSFQAEVQDLTLFPVNFVLLDLGHYTSI